MSEATYLVVRQRPWNRRVFDEAISAYPGDWHFIGSPEQLMLEAAEAFELVRAVRFKGERL